MDRRGNDLVLTTGFVALDVVRAADAGPPLFAAGGSCGNVSANLACLGLRVLPIALLGADDEGHFVIDDLASCGVRTREVEQCSGVRTPVVMHEILRHQNTDGDHRFRLTAPATGEPLPQYTSIDDDQVDRIARSDVLPRILYFDRLTPPILRMVVWAKANGAVTVFEPSEIGDAMLFASVQPHVDVIKFSADRLSATHELVGQLENPVQVVTRGPRGLTARAPAPGHATDWIELPAQPIGHVIDSAGAGDAVTAALIHRIAAAPTAGLPTIEIVLQGLEEGQRLAALNCAFVGARGAFRAFSPRDLHLYMSRPEGNGFAGARPRAGMPMMHASGRDRPVLGARYG